MTVARPVVDIHSHIYPRWYIDMLKARTEILRVSGEEGDERFVIFADEHAPGSGGGRPMTDAYWSVETKLRVHGPIRNRPDRAVAGQPVVRAVRGGSQRRGRSAPKRRVHDAGGANGRARTVGMGALPADDVDAIVTVIGEIRE